MRSVRLTALLAALALPLLGVLYVESRVSEVDDFNLAIDNVRRLRELDARLDRAVLESRKLDALTAERALAGAVSPSVAA